MLLSVSFIFCSSVAIVTEAKLEYTINRNGSQIGTLHFTKMTQGDKTLLKMRSTVKFRILALITANAIEDAVFDKDVMIWSSVYREINGHEKSNKNTKINTNNYLLINGKKTEPFPHYPIKYNMLCVYLVEPVNKTQIYSDNYQCMLNITTLGPHHYKIVLPNGDYNEYHYKNGICEMVDVHSTLYHSTIVLKK